MTINNMFYLPSNSRLIGLTIIRRFCDYRSSPMQIYGNMMKVPLLASKTVAGEILRHKHQVTYKPYVKPYYRDHDSKNMTLKRPMSPHLTIYAPTVPAMTSITQRITGTITTVYALLLAGGTLFLSNGIESYVSAIQSLDLSRPSIFVIKFILGAPFAYHYFCGIRYCAWNAGKWLAMKDVYATAYKSVVLAAIVALFFAIL
ncbi:succinate dehydrogenase cytochrome b560 subunit, mitochondrial-like [Galleria mellonella]|uniref:Succinate dehydrogenase cytochrome b560 subunit, mitochondrial-like n=1 Tax=Galleria mellonella TaxID=7137 RepID=A0A6J1WYW5_GALME|nr:succinate dehydrogenase cytochrome b560 subunit, mitochondrial-like [Galleria mellonella]